MRAEFILDHGERNAVCDLLMAMPEVVRLLRLLRDKPDAERQVRGGVIYTHDGLLFGVNPEEVFGRAKRVHSAMGLTMPEYLAGE